MHEFIKYTLVPLAFEQVSGIESALSHLDTACNTIASSTYYSIASRLGGGGETSPGFVDYSLSKRSVAADVSGGASAVTPKGRRVLASMEQAEVLRGELERVRSGIRLVSQSVDRLNNVLRISNRKMCGGLLEPLWGCCYPVTKSQGYSSVEMDDSHHPNSPLTGNRAARPAASSPARTEDDGL